MLYPNRKLNMAKISYLEAESRFRAYQQLKNEKLKHAQDATAQGNTKLAALFKKQADDAYAEEDKYRRMMWTMVYDYRAGVNKPKPFDASRAR